MIAVTLTASNLGVAEGQEPAPGFVSHSGPSQSPVGAQRLPKEDSNISAVIRGALSELQARGVERTNAREMQVSTLSVEGVLKIDDDGNIQTYIYVTEAGQPQITDLQSREVQVEVVNSDLKVIQGWIPFDRMEEIAALEFVRRVQAPGYAYTRTGSVTTEGDQILQADQVRNSRGITGVGVKVGVISDGVDSLATAQATGDLPGTIEIDPLRPGSGDEGTAMLEIIHDLAPGAALAFSGPGTSLEMIDSVNYLASQAFGGVGADIIVDDLAFIIEPFFEDGPIAQAVDGVASTGTIYVSSAGNSGDSHFEGDYIAGTDSFHDYGGGDIAMSVTVAAGGSIKVVLEWDDLFGASAQDYDLWACTPGSTPLVFASGGVCFASRSIQDGNDDPFEFIFLINDLQTPDSLDLFIDGFFASAVRRLEMYVYGAVTVNEHNVPGGSIFGHAAVPSAIAVGAIYAFDPGNDDIESFSSRGPSDVYFPSFTSRAKPDVAAIDGVSVTGAGGFPSPFFGTSAAAPHVAAVAALVLDAVRQASPGISKGDAATQVRGALLNTAIDLGVLGPDSIFGAGRADALAAVDQELPLADLSVVKSDSPDPVVAGASLSYTLTVANAGPLSATGVTLTDTLPAGLTFVSSAPGPPTCNESSGTVTCDLDTLASSGTTMVEVQVSVDPSTRGTLTNTASVASNETDPDPANNTSAATTAVAAEADVSVTKSDSPEPVIAGTDLSYTLTVTNSGPSSATGVNLTDTLSSAVSFGSASQGCGYSAGTNQVTCDLGQQGVGGTTTITVLVMVDSSATGTISNTASLVSIETDPDPTNNTSVATTTVVVEADLLVAKSDSPDPVIAATNLTYTLTVTNGGPSDATGVVITDALPSAVSYVSASSGCAHDSGANTVTCTLGGLVRGASKAVNIEVTVAASSTAFIISNNASVAGNETDPNVTNDTATQTTAVFPYEGFPSLSLWGLIAMAATMVLLFMRRAVAHRR